MFEWMFASLLLSSPAVAVGTDESRLPACGSDSNPTAYQFLECNGNNTALWVHNYDDENDNRQQDLIQIRVISKYCYRITIPPNSYVSTQCFPPQTVGGCLIEYTRGLCGKKSK